MNITAEFLGLPFIPPFANTGNSDILEGVNYASSGAGILIETGRHLVLHTHCFTHK